MKNGLHILSDFLHCDNQEMLINHTIYFEDLIKKIIESGMTIFSHSFHYFGEDNKSAYTGVIVLGESHISLHTFPEISENTAVTIDVYTCSLSKDNGEGCLSIYSYLKEIFKPKEIHNEHLIRRY